LALSIRDHRIVLRWIPMIPGTFSLGTSRSFPRHVLVLPPGLGDRASGPISGRRIITTQRIQDERRMCNEQYGYPGRWVMKRANLPGFTAETSLGPARAWYLGSLAGFRNVGAQNISPQMRVLPWQPRPDCNPNCACFSFVDCPCCIGPGPGGGWSRRPEFYQV
jgi:hypothetical protein